MKSWMSLVQDSFSSPKPRTSSWTQLAISFISTTMSIMPREDTKVSPSCCGNYLRGWVHSQRRCFHLREGSRSRPRSHGGRSPRTYLGFPGLCAPFVTYTSKFLLSWLLRLDLPERPFARLKEFGLVAEVTSKLLELILRSSSFHFVLFNPNEPLINKESDLLVKLSRMLAMLRTTNRLF